MNQECEACGLAACDLPDGIAPKFIFEKYEGCGLWLCQGCALLVAEDDAHEDDA